MGYYGSDGRERSKYAEPDTIICKLIHYQLEEVWQLLNGHYVEDDEAMFRFNYSVSFLNWY